MNEAGAEYPTAQSFTPLREAAMPSDLSAFDMTPEEYYADDESGVGADAEASTADEITAHEDADEIPAAPRPEPLRIPLTGVVSGEQVEPEEEEPASVKPAASAEAELLEASSTAPLDAEPPAADNTRRPDDVGDDVTSRSPVGGLATIEPVPKAEPAAEAGDSPAASTDAVVTQSSGEVAVYPVIDTTPDTNDVATEASEVLPIEAPSSPRYSPHYVYTGPVKDTPWMKGWYPVEIEGQRDELHLAGEVPPTHEELLGDIVKIQKAIVAVGREAGVDIEDRLTGFSHYHIFDTREAYAAAVTARWGKNLEISIGMQRPEVGIIVVRQKDTIAYASDITHETIHDVSLVRVEHAVTTTMDKNGREQNNIGLTQRVGYTHLSDVWPHGVNESLTDMTMYKTMLVAGYPSTSFRFAPINTISTAIVLETAAKQRTTASYIENKLIRGMLTSDTSGLERINDFLGERRWDTFINLRGNLEWDDALHAARELSLPTAVRAIENYQAGKGGRLFDWWRLSTDATNFFPA